MLVTVSANVSAVMFGIIAFVWHYTKMLVTVSAYFPAVMFGIIAVFGITLTCL